MLESIQKIHVHFVCLSICLSTYIDLSVLKTSICFSILLTGGSTTFSSGCSSVANVGNEIELPCALTGLEEAGVIGIVTGNARGTGGSLTGLVLLLLLVFFVSEGTGVGIRSFSTRLDGVFFVLRWEVPVCVRRCLFSSSLLENDFPHPGKEHLCGFSPVCVLICLFLCSSR